MGRDLPPGIGPLLLPCPALEAEAIGPTFLLGHDNGLLFVVAVIVCYGATLSTNHLPDDNGLLLKVPIAPMRPFRDLHAPPPSGSEIDPAEQVEHPWCKPQHVPDPLQQPLENGPESVREALK